MANWRTKSKSKNKIKKLLPNIKENVSLKEYTTFKIGGKTKYFFQAKTKEEIILAVKLAKKFNLPFFILGGGSNLLFSEKNFSGLIIKVENKGIEIKDSNIIAEAGVPLSFLVLKAKENALTGLEWAAGIPGTVGGAIFGNVSAFGGSIKDLIKWVEVLDTKDLKVKKISKSRCQFKYKDSIFKKEKRFVILSASFHLKKGKKEEIEGKIKKFLEIRKERHPLNYPSAGCVFKNLRGQFSKIIKNKKLLKKFPELNEFIKKGEIPAGYLIEKAGLKGKKIGKAEISLKHANFIINLGGAKSREVKSLINLIKKRVKKIFGVDLEEEIIIFPH